MGERELIGHAPVQLSSLLLHFMNADQNNFIKITVIGKRKHEIGLVVPAQYDCYTKIKRISEVLDKELGKQKEKYLTLEHFHQNKNY